MSFLKYKTYIVTGALLMALAVIMGAFAAHGLAKSYEPKMVEVFKTGVTYQAYHSLGIILIGILSFLFPKKNMQYVFFLFLIGITLFSGSLYAFVLTENNSIGIITPFGGLSFILGWIAIAATFLKAEKSTN